MEAEYQASPKARGFGDTLRDSAGLQPDFLALSPQNGRGHPIVVEGC